MFTVPVCVLVPSCYTPNTLCDPGGKLRPVRGKHWGREPHRSFRCDALIVLHNMWWHHVGAVFVPSLSLIYYLQGMVSFRESENMAYFLYYGVYFTVCLNAQNSYFHKQTLCMLGFLRHLRSCIMFVSLIVHPLFKIQTLILYTWPNFREMYYK
jgi:hypothetical protein